MCEIIPFRFRAVGFEKDIPPGIFLILFTNIFMLPGAIIGGLIIFLGSKLRNYELRKGWMKGYKIITEIEYWTLVTVILLNLVFNITMLGKVFNIGG